MKIAKTLPIIVLICLITSCCKEKDKCINTSKEIKPFWQLYSGFECGSNAAYEFAFFNHDKIDSITHNSMPCFFYHGENVPFVDKNYAYIALADTFFNYNDTMYTHIYKDSCNKILTYDVTTEQRTKTPNPGVGVVSIYSIVENITPDYKVIFKSKYVKLP